jgi:pentatricopeptide repeat protein
VTDATDATDKYLDAMRRFSGDLRMVRQVFTSMQQREVAVGEPHYRLLLKAHLDARDLAGASQVLADMQAAGIEVDAGTRWDVAIATGRAGRTDQALAMLDQLHEEGVDPDPDHAPQVLGIYLAAKRFPAARAVVRQMAQRGQAAGDADYEALLRDCLDRRAIKDTRTVVDLMLQVGRAPAPRLATELVAMIARAGHTDRALSLLEHLREGGVELPGDVHTELLLAHAKAGDAEAAEQALDAMRQGGAEPTSFHRNAVLQARIGAGDADGAWAVALGLAQDGRIPSGENLEGLIDVSLAGKRLAAASGVIDWMLILGVPVPPQKAADVISRHLQAGELDTAIALFEETVARGVPADRRTARDLVERLVRAKRLDEAKALLDRLRAAGTLTHGRHYGSLLNALVAAKRADERSRCCARCWRRRSRRPRRTRPSWWAGSSVPATSRWPANWWPRWPTRASPSTSPPTAS